MTRSRKGIFQSGTRYRARCARRPLPGRRSFAIRWGMSIAASGSVQRTSSRSPGAIDFSAFRVRSAGRGHFSPVRSSLVRVMPQHAPPVWGASIATDAAGSHRSTRLEKIVSASPAANIILVEVSPTLTADAGMVEAIALFHRPVPSCDRAAMIEPEPGPGRKRFRPSRAEKPRP